MARTTRDNQNIIQNNSIVITTSDGENVNLNDVSKTLTYNGSSQLIGISFTYNSKTYLRTFTYTSGLLTGISNFIKQ